MTISVSLLELFLAGVVLGIGWATGKIIVAGLLVALPSEPLRLWINQTLSKRRAK